ncbi:MAG: thiol:disulfide interchange protein DsbA/DsbL [Rubrivivax sp.]
MDRRIFFSAGLGVLTLSPFSVKANSPVEGQHYVDVSPRQPTKDPKRIEVVEFFAYGCEHCYAFEPTLDAWQRRLPTDVLFRRVPVSFRAGPMVRHQQLYYAIETLGLVDRLHSKVFSAMHLEKKRLVSPEDITAFVARHGVDPAQFLQVIDSPGVAKKVKEADALAEGYKFRGTPSLGIDGLWLTNGELAGSNEQALAVTEHLIALAKRTRKARS